jgi:hypothetical protein
VAARWRWLEPVLRGGIAAMWIIAGLVSLGLYPTSESLRLLTAVGIPSTLAPVALTGAALLDIALGVLALWPRAPRWIWTAQILLVVAYTAILTVKLPQLWLEPFGPVAKNLPILALLLLMQQLARRR